MNSSSRKAAIHSFVEFTFIQKCIRRVHTHHIIYETKNVKILLMCYTTWGITATIGTFLLNIN